MQGRGEQIHPRSLGRMLARYGVEHLERTGFTMNVSMGGAFVRTNLVHKPGTALRLELSAGERKIALRARVVWAKRVPPQMAQLLMCGMGLRFVEPGPEWSTFFQGWSTQHGVITRAK